MPIPSVLAFPARAPGISAAGAILCNLGWLLEMGMEQAIVERLLQNSGALRRFAKIHPEFVLHMNAILNHDSWLSLTRTLRGNSEFAKMVA
jgi:hypothetical protein